MLDNKWRNGLVKIILPSLPPEVLAHSGLKPWPLILDSRVGEEIVLLIMEPEELIREFKGLDIARFFTKYGMVNTSYGPVYWILFYFRNPTTGQTTTYEYVVNPKDEDHLSIVRHLASQKYWHIVFADQLGAVVNFMEFKNSYGLSDALTKVEEVCKKMKLTDFLAAKAEYERTYSIEELLNA